MPAMIKKLYLRILELIYPRRCPICDRILPVLAKETATKVCPECVRELSYVKEPFCMKCGKPLIRESAEYCEDCRRKHRSVKAGRAVFLYRKRMKDAMYRFKYSGRREYAEFFAEEAERRWGHWIKRVRPDLILPVPMYPAKKRKRGYNQAEDFADALGKRFSIPVSAKLIRRAKKTAPMKGLSESERRSNLAGAFEADTAQLQTLNLTRILLVDDIYTTGATIEATSKALLQAGEVEIFFLCICIGQGG